MLPVDFQIPAGLILLAVGLLACFAGYRLFRMVLTVYGFVLGALFASTVVAPSQTLAMIVAVLVGGLVGAALMYFGYFIGVMLVGAQTAVAGALALLQRGPRPRGAEPVWIAHLGIPAVSEGWAFAAWVVLGFVGTLVQLRSPAKRRR